MLWLIIAGLLLVVGIILMVVGVKEDEGSMSGLGFFLLLFGIVLGGCCIESALDWVELEKEISFMPTVAENKVLKIEKMKATYFNGSESKTIDLANQELASGINAEIKELEQYINKYNDKIASWSVKYKYRFFSCCFVKPTTTEPIKLSVYLTY